MNWWRTLRQKLRCKRGKHVGQIPMLDRNDHIYKTVCTACGKKRWCKTRGQLGLEGKGFIEVEVKE